ncbi:MAG: glutamyl-tRNA reductase [Pirellulaceae bacterium]
MKLQMIGCSHHQAAVEFRERLSFTAEQAQHALNAFRERFPTSEVVLLSTCNRVELYTAVDDDATGPDEEDVVGFLADQQSMSADELLDRLLRLSGDDAVRHLFTVAASLDSMVVGEAQIVSQVKQAYELARQTGSAGPLTHGVFQAASRVAKRVHRETAIHRRRVSVPSVAVGEVVPEFFDTLADKQVLLVGAGEMGQETLRYLKDAGARDIRIVNRSRERAEMISGQIGGHVEDWGELDRRMATADLVVSTTGATETLITAERFRVIHEARYERLMLILDLAVPRDFAADIGKMAGVYLYSVDDLQGACERNRKERQREWPKAEAIIRSETQRFIDELNHRATGPVIKQLREQAEEIKANEMKRVMGRLQNATSAEATEREIQQAMDRLVNKLLHPPLASIRDDAAQGHHRGLLAALRELFHLGD